MVAAATNGADFTASFSVADAFGVEVKNEPNEAAAVLRPTSPTTRANLIYGNTPTSAAPVDPLAS